MILSVSRRTDIPAFYSDWFFKQLKQGYVLVPNPINHAKIAKIKLEPLKITASQNGFFSSSQIETTGNIEGIVFWSKNPKPMLNDLHILDELKISYYFLYTLNAYPKTIEKNVPPLEERLNTFKELTKFCPVIWRYDPILLAQGIDVKWHLSKFEELCKELCGYTKICKISFVIESYKGCSNEVKAPSLAQKNDILAGFSNIAKKYNIKIEACAESGDWKKYGILPSKCIDGEIFEKLLTNKFSNYNITVKRKNNKLDGQRKFCGCMPSIDIGQYDTCYHDCNYCYAKKSNQKSMLDTPIGEIYERKTDLEFEYK